MTVTNVVVGSSTSLTANFVLICPHWWCPHGDGHDGRRDERRQTFTINLPPPGSTAFNFTGSPQTFTVPAGVVSLTIVATGAQGGVGRSTAASGVARVVWAVGRRRPCPSRRARRSPFVSVASAHNGDSRRPVASTEAAEADRNRGRGRRRFECADGATPLLSRRRRRRGRCEAALLADGERRRRRWPHGHRASPPAEAVAAEADRSLAATGALRAAQYRHQRNRWRGGSGWKRWRADSGVVGGGGGGGGYFGGGGGGGGSQ